MTLVHALSILFVAAGQVPAPAAEPDGAKAPPQPQQKLQLPEPRLIPVKPNVPPRALVPDGAPGAPARSHEPLLRARPSAAAGARSATRPRRPASSRPTRS